MAICATFLACLPFLLRSASETDPGLQKALLGGYLKLWVYLANGVSGGWVSRPQLPGTDQRR